MQEIDLTKVKLDVKSIAMLVLGIGVFVFLAQLAMRGSGWLQSRILGTVKPTTDKASGEWG